MAQGRSTKIISTIIEWIHASRLSIKNSLVRRRWGTLSGQMVVVTPSEKSLTTYTASIIAAITYHQIHSFNTGYFRMSIDTNEYRYELVSACV